MATRVPHSSSRGDKDRSQSVGSLLSVYYYTCLKREEICHVVRYCVQDMHPVLLYIT